jgi:hypothetical protein
MRKYLKRFLIFLFLLVIVFLALPFLAAPWACHIGGDIVCFGGAAEVTGSVWGPCNYTGAVEIIDEPPVNWWVYSNFKCVAAGRADGKTYAAFIREAWADSIGDPFKSEAERDLCYCAKGEIALYIFGVKPDVLIAYPGILVVDVEGGVGYLSIVYRFPPFQWLFNYSYFIFGGDGVYLNIEGFETLRYMSGLEAAVGAKREIGGPLLEGCAYHVKVRLEPEKLTISQPLYNATARAVRVG